MADISGDRVKSEIVSVAVGVVDIVRTADNLQIVRVQRLAPVSSPLLMEAVALAPLEGMSISVSPWEGRAYAPLLLVAATLPLGVMPGVP